jgi:hypothetical protein
VGAGVTADAGAATGWTGSAGTGAVGETEADVGGDTVLPEAVGLAMGFPVEAAARSAAA